MAQKDKVKGLVGRSLNSYHTKALQQINRIKKKYKEHNHKINILTSELDNDYITKTEEGSVISLEHSKEGMIYLDELQGNTMVNYCTDGSKELTLNGDIDVEGTNVTLTEGVDNGKVDIVCEGNTLVNLIQSEGSFNNISDYFIHQATDVICSNGELKFTVSESTGVDGKVIINKKENTYYTVVYTTKTSNTNTKSNIRILTGSQRTTITTSSSSKSSEYETYKFLLTPTVLGSHTEFYLYYRGETSSSGDIYFKNVMVLEGDWTNKEIPQYFEGMKSVGECEGNKIEILSTDVRVDLSTVKEDISISYSGDIGSDGSEIKMSNRASINNVCVREGSRITIEGVKPLRMHFYDINKNWLGQQNENVKSFTVPSSCKYIAFAWDSTLYNYNDLKIISSNLNKKEISLSEPLRGLPNGTKDKFIRIGGKWYIEKNCYQTKFNTTNFDITIPQTAFANGYQGFYSKIKSQYIPIKASPSDSNKFIISDKVGIVNHYDNIIGDKEGVGIWADSSADIIGRIKVNTTEYDSDITRQYIDSLDLTIVYQLSTPVYEEIADVTLTTYLDVTHISNNSTIPCNMKVKNSGHSTIIKPNTQYTVALDTNKNSEIGINLGGAKVTTNNNVATITTPATLEDSELRLYGKGVKSSKVRLLEGDKTNWIPSYFEGMQSSFEDKLQDDGTLKIEILSRNSDNTKSNKIQFSSIEPLRGVNDTIKDKFIFKDDELVIERNCGKTKLNGEEKWSRNLSEDNYSKNRIRVSGASEKMIGYKHEGKLCVSNITNSTDLSYDVDFMNICGLYERTLYAYIPRKMLGLTFMDNDKSSIKEKWLNWLRNNNIDVIYELEEPTYEKIPFELQKIILEGYENGTLLFDTNIPPTVTTTYAGETPIIKATRLSRTEVLNNTNDINENIVPYLMDMDFRVICLQLETGVENMSISRLFGGTFEMLQRDILSNRYSKEEYLYRLHTYLSTNKISKEEYNKLGDMLNE